MKQIYFLLLLLIISDLFFSCNNHPQTHVQNQTNNSKENKTIVGGGCDGCELMFVGMPANINSIDTSAGWSENGQKLLITGTVYKIDGRTPASDVIIYYWHTDNKGYYSPGAGVNDKAKRHGYIRGWIKPDENGRYSIYTTRPAPYPGDNIPAHIHLSIKEANIENEYYIDDFVFDGDKYLIDEQKRNPPQNRGGSGTLRVLTSNNLQVAEHNIILGLNIPDYPGKNINKNESGLQIGEDNPSFIPFHAYGPDKGSRACPVCKYGRYHGIIYFVGNKPNWVEIKKWLSFLDIESIKRDKYLKAYFVYGNEKDYNKEKRQNELEKIGEELQLKKIALTFVPSMNDKESEVNLNKINLKAENTFIIYRHRSIIEKFIDLKPTQENFILISQTLDKTKGEYFDWK